MQAAVYFLNRMSEPRHMKKAKEPVGEPAQAREPSRERPRSENTGRVMNKSHSPLDLPLNTPSLWHGAFSSDSTEMSRRRGEFTQHASGSSSILYMHGRLSCVRVWIHHKPADHSPRHLHSSSRDPSNNHKKEPLHPPSSHHQHQHPLPARPAWCQGARWFCSQFK